MGGGGRLFRGQAFSRWTLQLQRPKSRIANVCRYELCQRVVRIELRRAYAHQEIASSCPLLCSHILYTLRSNAAAVKLPGALTPLPVIESQLRLALQNGEELQPALGVGPTTRSTAGDVEIES